jgi:hypothetical protein
MLWGLLFEDLPVVLKEDWRPLCMRSGEGAVAAVSLETQLRSDLCRCDVRYIG